MNAERARALLVGGLVAANVATLIGAGLAYWLRGVLGVVSFLIAAALVIVFFGIGQGVQVALAESNERVILAAAMMSYLFRIAALGGALALYEAYLDRFIALDRQAVFAGILVVTFAWVGGEIRTFRRLRIPVFDNDYQPPV